ncbi:MAG: aminotransferase, partial [Tabrizicola sp.]|nr:aminotransferase [Tabrizicola sp.]
ILRPQIGMLEDRRGRWRVLYQAMEAGLQGVAGLRLIPRPQAEDYMGSSFQFLLPDWETARVARFLAGAAARGVELKWFGAANPQGFTSRYMHWRYAQPEVLPQTDRVLAGLIDMRLPLTFRPADADLIARIIGEEIVAAREAVDLAPVAAPAAD